MLLKVESHQKPKGQSMVSSKLGERLAPERKQRRPSIGAGRCCPEEMCNPGLRGWITAPQGGFQVVFRLVPDPSLHLTDSKRSETQSQAGSEGKFLS